MRAKHFKIPRLKFNSRLTSLAKKWYKTLKQSPCHAIFKEFTWVLCFSSCAVFGYHPTHDMNRFSKRSWRLCVSHFALCTFWKPAHSWTPTSARSCHWKAIAATIASNARHWIEFHFREKCKMVDRNCEMCIWVLRIPLGVLWQNSSNKLLKVHLCTLFLKTLWEIY